MMLKRSECKCQCHSSIGSVSAVHIVACCESDDSDILTKFILENDPETMRARIREPEEDYKAVAVHKNEALAQRYLLVQAQKLLTETLTTQTALIAEARATAERIKAFRYVSRDTFHADNAFESAKRMNAQLIDIFGMADALLAKLSQPTTPALGLPVKEEDR